MRNLILGCGLFLYGCAPARPAHWAEGGARLEIPSARWVRSRGEVVLAPNGAVDVGGERELSIDPSGRVRDAEGESLALLEPDGRLVGRDDALLATVTDSAAKPADSLGGLAVLPDGRIVLRAADGEHGAGTWVGGCNASAAARRACTLVAYLVTRADDQRDDRLLQRDLRRGRRDR
jgi:hypothetical protein